MPKETNTGLIITDAEYEQFFKKELITPLDSLRIEENIEHLEEEHDITTVSDGLSQLKSTFSRMAIEPKSLIEITKKLIALLASIATRLKNTFTSEEFTIKAIETVRLLRSILRPQYLRHTIQSIFNLGEKLIKLTTVVNATNGMTNVSFEFLPTILSSE